VVEHSSSFLEPEELAHNIEQVRNRIAEAAQKANRPLEEITLIAVSKTKPVELVQLAFQQGLTHFGENRVQEALPKIATFHPEGIHWHMIGHLQSNKAGKVVEAFDMLQSVDSLHLAQVLERLAASREKHLPILLEINIAGEASKAGMRPEESLSVAREIAAYPHLDIQGVMTVAPLVTNPEEVRPVFRALRELRDRLRDAVPQHSWHHLSMGMTDDYQVAIEEGATMVRIGRAIFGARPSR
jgi:pyridoxal phosphate enzyme (YggS family)